AGGRRVAIAAGGNLRPLARASRTLASGLPRGHSTLTPLAGALQAPAQQHAANRESCPDRGEQHEVALLQVTLGTRISQRQRNRGSRRVAEAIEVDDDLVGRE